MLNVANITTQFETHEANESLGTPVPFTVGSKLHIVAPGFPNVLRDVNGVRAIVADGKVLESAEDFPFLVSYGFAKIPGYEAAIAVAKGLSTTGPTGLYSFSPSYGWTQVANMDNVPHFYLAGEFDLYGNLYIPTYYGINAPRFIRWSQRDGFTYPDADHDNRFFWSVAIVANADRSKLYVLPYIGGNRILKIDVLRNEVEYIGPQFPTNAVKFGPQLPHPLYIAADGKIYLSSFELDQFVRIDPNTDQVEFYGDATYAEGARFIGAVPIERGTWILSLSRSPSQPVSLVKMYNLVKDIWFISPTPLPTASFGNVFGLAVDLSSLTGSRTVIFPGALTVAMTYSPPKLYHIRSSVAFNRTRFRNLSSIVASLTAFPRRLRAAISVGGTVTQLVKSAVSFRAERAKLLKAGFALQRGGQPELMSFVYNIRPIREIWHKKHIVRANVVSTHLERLNKIPYWSCAIAFAFEDVLNVSTSPQEAYVATLNLENELEYRIKVNKSNQWQINHLRVVLASGNKMLSQNFYDNLKLGLPVEDEFVDITPWLVTNGRLDMQNGVVTLPSSFFFAADELEKLVLNRTEMTRVSRFVFRPPWEKIAVYVFYTAVYDVADDSEFEFPFVYKTLTELEDMYGRVSPSNLLVYAAALQKQLYPEQPVIVGLGRTIDKAFEKLAKDPNVYAIAVASPVKNVRDITKLAMLAEEYGKIVILALSRDLFYRGQGRKQIYENLIDIVSDVRSSRVRLVMNPEFVVRRPFEHFRDVMPGSLYTVVLAGAIAQQHRAGRPQDFLPTAMALAIMQPFWRLSNVEMFNSQEIAELARRGFWIVDETFNNIGVVDHVTTEKTNQAFYKEPAIRIVDYARLYLTLKAREQLPRQTATSDEQLILSAIERGISELVGAGVIAAGRIKRYEIRGRRLLVDVEVTFAVNLLTTIELHLEIGA